MLYEEARVYLDSVSKYGSVLGLDSIKNLLEELGNPQKELTFIPVSYTHLRAHETLANLLCRLLLEKIFFLMIRRPPRSTLSSSSAASDVYKRQQ